MATMERMPSAVLAMLNLSGDEKTRLDTTLVKGFAVLTLLTNSPGPMSILAISKELGMGKSNVHRLVTTLTELGFVTQEIETKRYAVTLKLWELGSTVIDRNMLCRTARPVLKTISEKTGFSVFVTALVGTDILYVEYISAKRGPRPSSRAGLRVPAVFTAAGKVLLAAQKDPAPLVDHVMATVPAAAALNRTKLLEEIAQIGEQGYGFSEGGWTKGINSLAVAVPAFTGSPLASLGCAASQAGLPASAIDEHLPMLMDGAERIGEMLGPQTTLI